MVLCSAAVRLVLLPAAVCGAKEVVKDFHRRGWARAGRDFWGGRKNVCLVWNEIGRGSPPPPADLEELEEMNFSNLMCCVTQWHHLFGKGRIEFHVSDRQDDTRFVRAIKFGACISFQKVLVEPEENQHT